MLRTNHGFWFLCAVLQGNSPPAFSLVFLLPFLLSLSHYLHFLSFTYITCTYVYIYICIFHSLHYNILYRCTCVIFADIIKQPSFYLFFHFHCSISFCLLFLHTLFYYFMRFLLASRNIFSLTLDLFHLVHPLAYVYTKTSRLAIERDSSSETKKWFRGISRFYWNYFISLFFNMTTSNER